MLQKHIGRVFHLGTGFQERLPKENVVEGEMSKVTSGGRTQYGAVRTTQDGSSRWMRGEAAIGAPQTSRAWSGPQQSYSEGARLVEGKPSNRNTSLSTIWVSIQRPN